MKNALKYCVLLLLGLMAIHPSKAQEISAWYGVWKGSLELYKPDGTVDKSVPMELVIKPTKDSLVTQWKVTYHQTEVRDQKLIANDSLKGVYYLDDPNGIRIEVRKFGKVMMSNFEVMDFQINNTYELTGMTIWFTLSSSKTQLHTQSGKGTNQAPIVKSVPPNVFQRAILMRQ